MRIIRTAAAALLAVAATLAVPAPARAGGFATTVLDPLPSRMAAGTAYTVGFWVLQHGSHPYRGELGKVALRLTDEQGGQTTYPAAALPEPGHFAAAVVFGHSGAWQVTSIQGLFREYRVGVITVPGGVTLQPDEFGPIQVDYRHWGAIRPPQRPREAVGAAPAVAGTPLPGAAAAPPPPRGGSWGAAVIGGGVLATAAGLLFLRRRSAKPFDGPARPTGPR